MATARETGPELITKPGSKSVLWGFFGLEISSNGDIVDKDRAICRTCYRKVSSKNGNTSNLLAHLRTSHSKLYSEAKASMGSSSCSSPSTTSEKRPANQPSLPESFERVQKYERKGKRWKELTNAVTYFLAKDCQALYTVEKPGFRKFLDTFDSRYEIPSRNYFSRTALPTLYAQVRDRIKTELTSVKYFAATSDLWSSDGTLIPYIVTPFIS